MTDHRDEHEPYGITPPVKDADIVPWLRCEADAAAHQPSPWLMLSAAADAIERLRADVMCLKYQNAEFVRNLTMAQDERNTAVAERDEARREVSFLRPSVCLGAQTAHEYAKSRGWSCFKEDGKH